MGTAEYHMMGNDLGLTFRNAKEMEMQYYLQVDTVFVFIQSIRNLERVPSMICHDYKERTLYYLHALNWINLIGVIWCFALVICMKSLFLVELIVRIFDVI